MRSEKIFSGIKLSQELPLTNQSKLERCTGIAWAIVIPLMWGNAWLRVLGFIVAICFLPPRYKRYMILIPLMLYLTHGNKPKGWYEQEKE